MGDPRAVAIFSVKVPRDEPGPWLGMGNWRPWRQRSTSTKGLDGWFRNNEPHLRRDAFATINRFYRWERTQEYVVRLGATFVDIDCGRRRSDWSAWEATEILRDLVQRGLLARPSMLQYSGRGLWAFWLLRDEQDPSTTPFANADNRELHRLASRRVNLRKDHLARRPAQSLPVADAPLQSPQLPRGEAPGMALLQLLEESGRLKYPLLILLEQRHHLRLPDAGERVVASPP